MRMSLLGSEATSGNERLEVIGEQTRVLQILCLIKLCYVDLFCEVRLSCCEFRYGPSYVRLSCCEVELL